MTGLRLLGAIFLVVIVVGYTKPLRGDVMVALIFYIGCGGIILLLIVWIIRSYW